MEARRRDRPGEDIDSPNQENSQQNTTRTTGADGVHSGHRVVPLAHGANEGPPASLDTDEGLPPGSSSAELLAMEALVEHLPLYRPRFDASQGSSRQQRPQAQPPPSSEQARPVQERARELRMPELLRRACQDVSLDQTKILSCAILAFGLMRTPPYSFLGKLLVVIQAIKDIYDAQTQEHVYRVIERFESPREARPEAATSSGTAPSPGYTSTPEMSPERDSDPTSSALLHGVRLDRAPRGVNDMLTRLAGVAQLLRDNGHATRSYSNILLRNDDDTLAGTSGIDSVRKRLNEFRIQLYGELGWV